MRTSRHHHSASGAWRPFLASALVLVMAMVAGCGADAPQDPGAAPESAGATADPGVAAAPSAVESQLALPPADPAAVQAVRSRIDAADLGDPETIDALAAVRFDDGAPEAAEQALADGVTGAARWAATWTYASSGTDPAVLRPILDGPDLTLRAMAAAALTAWGDAAGIPVLVQLAGVEDRLAGSYPPTTIGQFASGSLSRFVDGPAVGGDMTPADLATAWTAWLAEHELAAITFDPELGTWSAR